MATVVFDTLQYAKKLRAAGFTEQQAEVQAEAIAEIIDEKLATKKDLEDLTLKLTIRMGGFAVAIISILAAIIKL